MTSGHRAGAATVLLANAENQGLKEHEHTGMWIDRLDDLIAVLEGGFEEGLQQQTGDGSASIEGYSSV